MGNVLKPVNSFLGSVTKPLFGSNDQKSVSSVTFADRAGQEQQVLNDYIKNLAPDTKGIAQQADEVQIQNLFKSALTKYLSGGINTPQATVDPESLKQITQFVDSTFTNPTTDYVNQQLAQFGAQQAQRGAVQGRAQTDPAVAARYAQAAAQQYGQIGMQKGQQIQQQALLAQERAYNAPQQYLQNSLLGLQGLGQVQQQRYQPTLYISDLNQRAQQNRLAISNLLTNERISKNTTTNTQYGKDNGILGKVGQFEQFGASMFGMPAGGVGGIGGGGLGGIGGGAIG